MLIDKTDLMKTEYNAAIIGCGNIGALFDRPTQKKNILTHAHAYLLEPRTQLCAMVDADAKKAQDAAKTWGGIPYSDAREMLENENPEIISICVPDELHKEILDLCCKYHPKAVFCEKPLTLDMKSAEDIIKKYNDAGIHLAVNFSRRWDPTVQQLKKEFEIMSFGKILNVSGIYTKGILHNGSHMINLLEYLFGSITRAVPLACRVDWKEKDPTIDAFIMFSNGVKAHLSGADSRNYGIFEVDILCEKARFCFNKTGLQIIKYNLIKNPVYSGYMELAETSREKTGLNNALLYAVSNIIDTLEGKSRLLCTGTDAYNTQKTCLMIRDKYQNQETKK